METYSVERFARAGFEAYRDGDFKEAAELFRKALDLDRQRNQRQPDMRWLSYYGMSLAKAGLSTKVALQACTRAVSLKRNDPVLYLNLGRVYAMSGQTVLAMKTFEQGLAVSPDNVKLRTALGRLDRRGAPVISFLSRDHAINRWLGRMRANSRRKREGSALAPST